MATASTGKPAWASKTLWASVISAGLGVLTALGVLDVELDPAHIEEVAGGIAIVLGAVFAALRFVTSEPLK